MRLEALMRIAPVTLTVLFLGLPVHGQVVQLPTFHQFSISTTVVVPDRGSVSLVGVGRSARGSSQFGAPGLPGNRSFGAAAGGTGVSATAQVHDFEAMDRALLAKAAAMRGADHRVSSVAEIQRQKSLETKPPVEDAQSLLARADEARDTGNMGAARVYLKMAARRATGPLREEALAKYDAWGKSEAVKSQTDSKLK